MKNIYKRIAKKLHVITITDKAGLQNENFFKEQKKELKAVGIKKRDKATVEEYFAEKKKLADEKVVAEATKLEREANPSTEDFLKKILAEMQK